MQFDAASNSGYQAASSSYNWAHVVGTGNSQILVVSVGLLSVTNSVTSITYNSVALTKLRSDVSVSNTVRTEIWYLLAPSTGSNSVAVTLNTASVSGSAAVSYNNVDQSNPIDAQNGGTDVTGAGGGSASISTTTVTAGAWLIDAVTTPDTAITVGSGQTQRANITGAVGSAGQSDKAVASPAATTMQWDNVAALTSWTMSTVALKPIANIGVSDSATVSESLNYYSDQIDVNERLNILNASNISKSDNLTVTESIGILNVYLTNKSDDVTISEAVQLTNSDPQINVSDTATLSENTAININSLSGIYDTITISESVSAEIFQPAYWVSVSDSISGGLTGSANVIVLLDGRIAVRISNNLYLPL